MEPSGASQFAIDVRGLGKSFAGRKVVDDFSIRVRRGHIFGFLGPNGSGKTTTIRLLCGLLTPDAGEGTCLGFDLRREAGAIKRRVGYMTQRFSLYEDLSVRENLEFVARIYALDDGEGEIPFWPCYVMDTELGNRLFAQERAQVGEEVIARLDGIWDADGNVIEPHGDEIVV